MINDVSNHTSKKELTSVSQGWPRSSSFFCRRPSIPAGVASVAQGPPLRLPASGRCDKIFDGRPKIFNGAAAPRRPAALSPSHDLRTAAEIGSSARHGGDPSHRYVSPADCDYSRSLQLFQAMSLPADTLHTFLL